MDAFTFSNATSRVLFSSSVRLPNISSPLATCSCSLPNCALIPFMLSPSPSTIFILCCKETCSASTLSIRTPTPLMTSPCFPPSSFRFSSCCFAHSLSSTFTFSPYSLPIRAVASNAACTLVFTPSFISASLICISPTSFRSSLSVRVICSIAASIRPCILPLASPSSATCSSTRCCPRFCTSWNVTNSPCSSSLLLVISLASGSTRLSRSLFLASCSCMYTRTFSKCSCSRITCFASMALSACSSPDTCATRFDSTTAAAFEALSITFDKWASLLAKRSVILASMCLICSSCLARLQCNKMLFASIRSSSTSTRSSKRRSCSES
mmetsp:Transcript_46156/g.76898  ORF Transcript_46156/g.76898 Transcript_46156/m.76898 type:complete len:325 (+) Transcript_46156:1009-1983(+)